MKNNITKKEHQTCACCGKPIRTENFQQAELSTTDDRFYADGVPADHKSQGWFPIGSDCWKKHVIKGTAKPKEGNEYQQEINAEFYEAMPKDVLAAITVSLIKRMGEDVDITAVLREEWAILHDNEILAQPALKYETIMS